VGRQHNRREFLAGAARAGGAALACGVLWAGWLAESRAQPFALRPPGALAEGAYEGACIKCGQCVDACPYATLALAPPGAGSAVGVPFFRPREVPCYMCPDVPCARACPTGALARDVVIDEARMGLAVLIDQETCLAFRGLRCEVCYRACPLLDRAITLEYRPQEQTGLHAYFLPVVHAEACTGCGLCEHTCVLERAAIRVLPHRLAQGAMAAGGVAGPSWDAQRRTPIRPRGEAWEREALPNALEALKDTEALRD